MTGSSAPASPVARFRARHRRAAAAPGRCYLGFAEPARIVGPLGAGSLAPRRRVVPCWAATRRRPGCHAEWFCLREDTSPSARQLTPLSIPGHARSASATHPFVLPRPLELHHQCRDRVSSRRGGSYAPGSSERTHHRSHASPVQDQVYGCWQLAGPRPRCAAANEPQTTRGGRTPRSAPRPAAGRDTPTAYTPPPAHLPQRRALPACTPLQRSAAACSSVTPRLQVPCGDRPPGFRHRGRVQ